MVNLEEFKSVIPGEIEEWLFRANPSDYAEITGNHEAEGLRSYRILRKVEIKIDDQWRAYPSIIFVIDPNIFDDNPDWVRWSYYAYFTTNEAGRIVLERSYLSKHDRTILDNAKKDGIETIEVLND